MSRQAGEQPRGERQQGGGSQDSKQDVSNRAGAARHAEPERERQIQPTRDRNTATSRRFATDAGAVGYGTNRSQALVRHMADDIDQLLQLFGFGGLGLRLAPELRTIWSPQIDVHRADGQIVVRADLPGVNPRDVKVEVEDGALTISGERREEHEEKGDQYSRTERVYGQFFRAVPLPEGVDDNQIQASFDNGVLEIRVPEPKQQPRQAKRVEVTSRG